MFGIHYIIVVSFITMQFKVRYQKKQTLRSLASTFFVQILIGVLAVFATLNLPLCILINIIVPFFLVFLQSSQFNPKGYFSSAMCFVFLQLRPVGPEGFLPLMEVVVYGMSLCVIALCFNPLWQTKNGDFHIAKRGLLLLSQSFAALAHGEHDESKTKELFAIEQSLHRLAYHSRGSSYIVTGEGKIYHMFALLLQRTMYYITEDYNDGDFLKTHESDLQKFADYLKLACEFNQENNDVLIMHGEQLRNKYMRKEDTLSLLIDNSLNLLILTLKEVTSIKATAPQNDWKLPSYRRPLQSMFNRLHMDSFEFRFALRLSAVLVIGFAFSQLTGWEHSYWLPLNGFLLLQPIYEESNKRLKTRFIGTIMGCSLIYIVLPFLPGLWGHFIFANVMIMFMYCSTPGTWNQALFSTCFALTFTSLAMQQSVAIELRLIYVVLAIILVLVINRFLFPVDAKRQFHGNISNMFHLQHSYLRILQCSMRETIDYGIICDALLSFHMTYEQIEEYLKKYGDEEEKKYYRHMLALLWRMVSEMEQILFLMNNRKITLVNKKQIYEYVNICDYNLHRTQDLLHMKAEEKSSEVGNMEVKIEIEGAPYFGNLLKKYERNVFNLYKMVSHKTMTV